MVGEAQHKNDVLAVSQTHQVWVQGRPQPVGLRASLLPEEAWVVLSAGEDRRGPRREAWAWLPLPDEMEGTAEHARLRADPAQPGGSERASLLSRGWSCHDHLGRGRAGGRQSASRSKRAMNKPKAKGVWISRRVRTWRAWYRSMMLARLSYAALVVMQGQARAQEKNAELLLSGSS